MDEEIKTPEEEVVEETELSLDDLAEFSIGADEEAVTLDEEEIVLAEDLEGFAKGFPDWDLLPPKD